MRNLALLFILLITLLLGCVEEGGGGGVSTCHQLWADCPGIANDYMISSNASDLEQEVSNGVRYFSYYNCSTGRRTPTLNVPAECAVSFKY